MLLGRLSQALCFLIIHLQFSNVFQIPYKSF